MLHLSPALRSAVSGYYFFIKLLTGHSLKTVGRSSTEKMMKNSLETEIASSLLLLLWLKTLLHLYSSVVLFVIENIQINLKKS